MEYMILLRIVEFIDHGVEQASKREHESGETRTAEQKPVCRPSASLLVSGGGQRNGHNNRAQGTLITTRGRRPIGDVEGVLMDRVLEGEKA